MNTHIIRQRGTAIVFALIVMALAAMIGSAYLGRAANDVLQTRYYNEHKQAMGVAEAGMDKAVLELKNAVFKYGSPREDDLADVEPPSIQGYTYTSPNGLEAFQISPDGNYHHSAVIAEGRWAGMHGDYQRFELRVGTTNLVSGRGVVLTQAMQALAIPVFQFGVFYEEDLEILPGPNMIFAGPVHTNEDLYVGCNNSLHFSDKVTTHEKVYCNRKDDPQVVPSGTVYIKDADGNYQSMSINGQNIDHTHDQWAVLSVQRWDGRFIDSAHAVPEMRLPIPVGNEPHDIIERADPAADPEQLLENKFETKADIIIWVDASGSGHARTGSGSEFPLELPPEVEGEEPIPLVTTAKFADFREGNGSAKTMSALDLDIGVLRDHPGFPPDGAVVYVYNENRDVEETAVVRLVNGSDLPPGGLTVATPNPIYIKGDYNNSGLTEPSLVVGDAVNILSNAWDDARSSNASTSARPAAYTEVNTVVMTGNTDTVVGQYNGGLENVLRFLENWSGVELKFRGSIICMWNSEIATGPWVYGKGRYEAPRRNWGYDEMYRDPRNSPPGVPSVIALEALTWKQSTWTKEELSAVAP